MTNLAVGLQENLEGFDQFNPSRDQEGIGKHHSMESIPSLIPDKTRKPSWDVASDSVKQIAKQEEYRPRQARRTDFNFETYEPKRDVSPGLWLKTLGVQPLDRPEGMHKRIPTNLSRLRDYQKVR